MGDKEQSRRVAVEMARAIETMDHVRGVIQLPDIHMKPGMEAPSSIVVASDRIIPHLVSESINDGMGVVVTDLTTDDVSEADIADFLGAMNMAGVQTKLKTGRYSWTKDEVQRICRFGASVVVEKQGLPVCSLEAMEDGGLAPDRVLSDADVQRLVPRPVLRSRIVRGETGLNFGGNHFVEVQAVDRILDSSLALKMGLRQGQIIVMYHLGPGPLGSIMSNLSAYRQKPPLHRKLGYGLGRPLAHSRRGWNAVKTFSDLSPWLALDPATPEGSHLAAVLAVIKNYGYAYRMVTVSAIMDALAEVFADRLTNARLLVDTSHNMLQPELVNGEPLWVSRHNCCRVHAGKAGIVAGTHEIASCIGASPATATDELGGYDHGIGFYMELLAERGEKPPTDPSGHRSTRYKMKRGHSGIVSVASNDLLSPEPMLEIVKELEHLGAFNGAVLARPLGTLKHVT